MEAYIGTICAFGFNFAPYGWNYCNGQVISIAQNAALFSLIGTYYGGNGTSTFALPDLQGRSSIHMGQLQGGSLYSIGQSGGTESVTLTVANLPQHTHQVSTSLKANSAPTAPSTIPTSNYNAASNSKPYNSTQTGAMKSFGITLGNSGGNIPIGVNDPYLVMNFCIAMQGIFPTRN